MAKMVAIEILVLENVSRRQIMNEQDDRLSGVLAILTVLALSVFIIWVILSLLV